MTMSPPVNSKIILTTDRSGDQLLKLPSPSNFTRYPVAAFLIFWLGGWSMGLVSASHELLTATSKTPNAFLIFWLGGWTVGGCFAIAALYRMLRPAVPETLTISKPELIYDSGIQPLDMLSFNNLNNRNRINPWKKIFQKRKIINFSQSDLVTLKLRDIDSGNRLTIDKDNERIDLGQTLSEVEREWLFAQLKSAYRL